MNEQTDNEKLKRISSNVKDGGKTKAPKSKPNTKRPFISRWSLNAAFAWHIWGFYLLWLLIEKRIFHFVHTSRCISFSVLNHPFIFTHAHKFMFSIRTIRVLLLIGRESGKHAGEIFSLDFAFQSCNINITCLYVSKSNQMMLCYGDDWCYALALFPLRRLKCIAISRSVCAFAFFLRRIFTAVLEIFQMIFTMGVIQLIKLKEINSFYVY